MSPAKWVTAGISFLVVIVLLFASVGTVPAGYVGVKTQFGAVKGTVQPGLYVQIPFIQSVVIMDTQTQKEEVTASAASNDLQDVTTKVAINFHVNPSDAGTIYSTIGADYQARVIDPAIQESIKSVTANYTAEQLITSREEVREKILALLTTKLSTFGVNTDSLNITDFAFSDTFNQAIEAKVTAEQNALAAKNKLAQVQYEAQQTVATAQAQAEAIKIQTEAITNGGGQAYVDLQAIKVQQAAVDKWDGHLPNQMIPGSALPFINVNSGKQV